MFRGDYNIYVNEAACDITGYTREELLGIPFWQLIRTDYQALVRERGMARLRGEAVDTHYEVPIVAKDGKTRWLQFAGNMIDYQGERAWIATTFDITPRVEIEEKLRLYSKRLELLSGIDRAGLMARSKQEIASTALNMITELVRCDRASITEIDATHHSHSILAVNPTGQTRIAEGRSFRLEHWHAVADSLKRGLHYVADLDRVPARTPLQQEIYEEGVRCYMSVPLSSQGKMVGVLNLG